MLTYLSASKIFPISEAAIKNGVLAIDEQGFIHGIYEQHEAEKLKISIDKHYEGYLVPGFVNTHCHLELAHLKGKIPTHSGLFRFVEQVMNTRNTDPELHLSAMYSADQEMFDAGIVAVGDISNQISSKEVKLKSKIYYHTFVEVMGFNEANAISIIEKAKEIRNAFAPLSASIVPHAPYSVSDRLFAQIAALSNERLNLLSIHNQETSAEDDFFRSKSGDFLKLYELLGLNIDFYQPSGKSSLQTTLPKLASAKTLLVHNTKTNREDVTFAKVQNQDLYWCLCPNANKYIENALPDVAMLIEEGLKITLGTDSLASNQQLSILKEMQTLQEQKGIDFETLLECATLNGASFLGLNDSYGTLSIGKKPGIVLLENIEEMIITDATHIRRLY